MSIKLDLMRPEAYGTVRPARVELVETHISWVFLLDHDVFKVKKPVDLGFLDFRTIEQRKIACDAEVRLNARLAPDVYRGVVAIRTGKDGLSCIDGHGPIVDWAVHMARLADECRADQLLSRNELSLNALDAIAERLATFHATTRADDETGRFGSAQAIRANIEENFAQTTGAIAKYIGAEGAAEIVRWQSEFVRSHEALFEERIAAGHVREGHGDLRLEHIYFRSKGREDSANPITIIDCIEFNERFRFGDVCADIAFLAMDLASQRRVDLAERLIAGYAREANDFDLYALIDFYESYRAYVRGKVSAIVARDEDANESTRRRAADDARRYFLLSLSADRKPLFAPALVAVGGVIASGKSTIAECVAAELCAPIVDADRTRKAMVGVGAREPIHEGAWQGAYDPAFTQEVYSEVLRRARVVLASGRPVVVDASFRSHEMRQAARDLAGVHNVPFRFVECRADASVCRARLVERERTSAVSDGRLAIFDAFLARFQPVTELPSEEHIVLDTTQSVDKSIAFLRTRIDTAPRDFVG